MTSSARDLTQICALADRTTSMVRGDRETSAEPLTPAAVTRARELPPPATRSEPVVALYEQNRVRHVGVFEDLENQMCQFDPSEPGGNDDRIDALVYAVTELAITPRSTLLDRRNEAPVVIPLYAR
jgi:phage terminase large subunit-like protein